MFALLKQFHQLFYVVLPCGYFHIVYSILSKYFIYMIGMLPIVFGKFVTHFIRRCVYPLSGFGLGVEYFYQAQVWQCLFLLVGYLYCHNVVLFRCNLQSVHRPCGR